LQRSRNSDALGSSGCHGRLNGRAVQRVIGKRAQQQLAELIDSTQRCISRYETIAEFPPAEVLVQLAQALDVSADALLGLDKPKSKETPKQDPETKRLWKKFQQLIDLPEKDHRAVRIAPTNGIIPNVHINIPLSTSEQYRILTNPPANYRIVIPCTKSYEASVASHSVDHRWPGRMPHVWHRFVNRTARTTPAFCQPPGAK